MAAIYRVGDRVDGLYDENSDDMWYPGRIRCVHAGEAEPDSADGPTFEVLYDDGEVETHVRPEFLRQHVPGTICVGTRVLCRYDGGEEYYPGQVSDVQENGRYTIAYDDGEVEEDVPLAHILEPKEEEKDEAEAAGAADEEEQEKTPNDVEPEQQQEEDENDEKDAEMEEAQKSPNNPAEDTFSGADVAQENEESVNGDDKSDEPVTAETSDQFDHPRPEQPKHNEAFPPSRQNEELPDPSPAGVSAERAYIIESLQLLEKRLGDSASTKSVLSTLVKQMRAYPQVTANLVHKHGGERLIIDALKFHQSHAVIQCYGFVLLRRLCFLCVKSTHYLLRNGIVELVIQAMNAFAEDAILQASACGALAVFTRVQSGLNILIEYQVAQLVLSTLIYHKTYSVHTRQVHYYACEVLLELCELDDLQTLNLLCGEQEEDFTGDMAPISLLLFLLRQGLSLDDKKACCAVGSLLMCLAASGKRAAALILGLNGIAELSTVMARYPTEPSIQKYSAAASKQIALCTVRQSPTKRIKDTATEILREAESLKNTPTDRQPVKKSSLRGRSTSIGKRKSNPATGYGAPSYPRGAAYTSSTPYRHTQGFPKAASPYGQGASGFGGDTSTFGYPARDFPGAATAPQQPSSLVILDGSLGMDSGFGSTSKRKQLSKEDRQSELFDAYGIQGVPSAANGRPYGTKRAQLRAHLASAESAWAPPQQHAPSSSKPYSSRSDYVDHGPAYSHRDFMSSRQNRWDDNDEPHHAAVYEPEVRQPRGAKRKKKNPAPRAAFQVKIENENQLRVSRETRSPYPSPQRLGVATKRAAKARQKRITAGGYSSLTRRSNNTSSESLNDYATQLFQDNVSRAGSGIPSSSKLTPREKEEIRERERLSFAEKLHKMIDKAKSTLANGSTTPVPAVDHTSRQKSSASSKTARKTRESSSDDKRPLSKKSRPAVSSTPKYTPKEILSPRESTEVRPAKPTSGASKRQAAASEGHQTPSGHQAPMVARAKQVASRPVVPLKVTSEQKPRTVLKSNKSAATKSAGKKEVEGVKESVATAVVAEVVPPSTPAINEPLQVDSDAVTVEASPETVDEIPVSTDTTPTQQVEPEVSNSIEAAAVEVETAPSEIPTEVVDPAAQGDNSPSNTPEQNVTAEETAIALTPSKTETITSPVDAPPPQEESVPDAATEKNVEAATDVPEATEEAHETTVPPLEEPSAMPDPAEDQPSGGSATVDAMYRDAYNEFDDNGGDDEDMTAEAGADAEDTPMHDTGASDPPNDVPLQESKSGEALYDDGYDEFDEDDTPNAEEAEADDVPAADTEANPEPETTDETSGVSVVGESEPAASVIETENEQVHTENDNPPDAPAENGSRAEEQAEAESAVQGGDVDDNAGGGETECAVAEPEESNDPQPDPADVAVISEESTSDPDVLVSNTEEEQNESTSPNLEGESVPDPTDDSNLDGSGGNEPVATEDAGGNDTSDDLVGAEGATLEEESSPEADTTTSVTEPTVVENEAGDAEAGIQSAAAEEEEAPATDLAGEAADFVDPASEEAQADPSPLQQDEDNSTEVTEAATEGLEANESAPLTEQDNEQGKTLLADVSVVSIQSAAYDEDNFDEEGHIEADPSEDVANVNSVSPPAEEAAEPVDQAADLVDPQQEQDEETSQVADAQVDANDATPDANNEEEDSKGLTANSSELSVQSEAYEDDDFDDGAHEEVAQENHSESQVQIPDQQPTVDEDAEVDEPVALPETDAPADGASSPPEVESEAPSEPVASGAEDLDNTAPGESSKGNADEALDTETTDEPSELQQVGPSDSAEMFESGTVAEVPAVEGTVLQDEAAEDQQAVDESDKHHDHPPTENSGENANGDDTKSDATTEDPVGRSDPLPDSDESTTAPSEPTDTDASQLPEITIPTDDLTQEEAAEQPDVSAQPATYDEDDFDNGGEEEQVPPSLTTQDSGLIVVVQMDEGLKDDEPDVQPSSEQTTNEAEGASAAESNFDESAVVSSEPELQADEPQEQPAIESESIPTIEDEIAANDVDASGEEPGDAVAADDDVTPNSPIDEEVVTAAEVPAPEPETTSSAEPELQSAAPNEQVIGEEGSASAQDNADEDVVPESAVDLAPANEAPESEPPSMISDVVETPANEYEPSAAEDVVTEQVPDSTQAGGELAGDSPESDQSPVAVTAVADTSAEPSDEATREENQYGDADFDEVEDDATALKEAAFNGSLAQEGPGETEETAAAEILETESTLPIDVAEPEESAEVVYDDPEFQTEEAEADPATAFASDETQMNQDPAEPAEATAEICGGNDEGASGQPADDDAPEAASGNPSDDIINAPDADTPSLESSPDATTYEEDFPSDTLPETNEEVPMGDSEEAATSDDNAVADSDSPAIESAASDVPAESAEPSPDVDEVPDASPSNEGYDEGFDEDTTTPVVDPSDRVDSTPVAEDAAVEADVDVSTTLETPPDADVAESDQLIEGEIDPSAETVAEDGQEVKPEDCDTENSVEVEPTETFVESEVVDPEAAELEAKPETSEVAITDPEAAAESNDVEAVSVETELTEPTGVEADMVNDEFTKSEEPDPVESPSLKPDIVEPKADAAEEPEAVEPETVAPEASEADAPQEPEAVEPDAAATEGPDAVESEIIPAADSGAVEPEAVSGQEPEALEPDAAAPEAVESEIVSAAEPEAIESEAVTAEEPELVEPEIVVTPEPSAVESEPVSVAPESGESEVVQSELAEANVGELETTETAALEAETTEAAAPEPDVHESEAVDAMNSVTETTESEAVPVDAAQSEDVENACTTADSAPALEPTLEDATANSPLDEPSTPEANPEDLTPEIPDVADPATSNSDEDLPMKAAAKDEEEVVEERNDPISVNEDAPEVMENVAVEEEASSEKIITVESADKPASSPIEAPVSEDPTVVVAAENPDHTEPEGGLEVDAPSDTQLPVHESADDPVYPDDLDADDDHGATEAVQNTGEVVSSDTSEMKEEPMPEAANPDPAEAVDLAPEDQTSIEPDDYYADPPEDEPPATALVDPAPAESIQDEAVEEQAPSTETPRVEPEQQAGVVDVPESSEKFAVDVVESPPDEIAIESPGVAASEGPATEDQYDDEDAFNEFEDQDNESAAPEAAPIVEIPAPSAAVTEAPATEDEYEDYENEDYGEEEKPAADPVPPLTTTRSEPPTSARKEEIEEVADEPEEAEEEGEAYANDQDDYNNEFEDDDAPASPPKASSPKKDKPVEASADEYEDDAEEDYAEDEEVEESSPRPAATHKSTAAPQPAATHSDDEMEEELGSDYADSDG